MSRDDEIRVRCEAATPGPWYRRGSLGQLIDATRESEDMRTVVADVWGATDGLFNTGMVERDAEFIVHTREDVPYLLGEKARLLRELDEMRQRAEVAEAKIEQVREAAKKRGRAHGRSRDNATQGG